MISSVLVKVARLGFPILMVENKLAQPFGKQVGNTDFNKYLFIHVHSIMQQDRSSHSTAKEDFPGTAHLGRSAPAHHN